MKMMQIFFLLITLNLRSLMKKKRPYYYVKWKGFSRHFNKFEPPENIIDQELINNFNGEIYRYDK